MFVCLFSKQMHMSGRRSESLGLPQNGCVDIYQVRPDAVGMLERPGTGGRQEEKAGRIAGMWEKPSNVELIDLRRAGICLDWCLPRVCV